MGRILGGVGAALVLLFGVGAVWFYTQLLSYEIDRVTDDVHVIRVKGVGGNVGVLATDEGAVVVDTMTFLAQGRVVREQAVVLGRGPAQAIINTHYHQDHTHGNPAFPAEMKVVATRATLDYLRHFDADFWTGEIGRALPNDLVDDTHTLRVGGKTIRSRHLGRGHTGGDLVVEFVEDRVIHLGDLLFNGRYPRVDIEAGGSAREWIGTLDRVLELDFDAVIPGHGPVTDREGILAFQRFLREVVDGAAEAAQEGLSLEETLSRVEITEDEGYDVTSIPFLFRIDRDSVVQQAWEEATGAVKPVSMTRSSANAGG